MLSSYINAAMGHARYKVLDDGSYFGEVPELPGVWANSETLEGCRKELHEVLEEWIALGLAHGSTFPSIDGATLDITEASA